MKFLTLKKGVILTEHITPAIESLDFYFEKKNLKAEVTSGLRTPEHQLEIIRQKAKKHGIDKEYPSILTANLVDKLLFEFGVNGQAKEIQVFAWQPAWSRLLTFGEMINPPLQAMCLFDYKRNGKLVKAGTMKDISPHMKGTAFDIGGGQHLDDIVDVIEEVYDHNNVPSIKGYLVEPVNNCVHIDVFPKVIE